jgi:hypothetical protein
MHLPPSENLPINLLASSFNNVSTSYKYYWLLSVIQFVEKGEDEISKTSLFSGMLANAWYTVNYFKVSFGKQDLIQDAIKKIQRIENITIDEKRDNIKEILLGTNNSETIKILKHFDKNVPHWFMSPWFPAEKNETDSQRRNRIYEMSPTFEKDCPYSLSANIIKINPKWLDYFVLNSGILKDFCYWNLALFLQSRNPNIPDIPNKIIKPAERGNLTKHRRKFWDLVFDELGSIECIYTGEKLTKHNYIVEHFIPHAFVSHDQIWNLIPANKSFNSTKSDKIPSFNKYFDSFFNTQNTAYQIIRDKFPENKFLEDYWVIFHQSNMSLDKIKFQEIVQPLLTIATNNGFELLNYEKPI